MDKVEGCVDRILFLFFSHHSNANCFFYKKRLIDHVQRKLCGGEIDGYNVLMIDNDGNLC